MLPGNTSTTLIGNFVRAQQGLIDSVRVSPDDVRLTVGEKVQAVVTNQLNNGRFLVLIKDQLLDLNLPRNTQPGQQFELTVLSKNPQLTFQLNTAPNQPATTALNQDARVGLSKGAVMIGELLQNSDPAEVESLKQSLPLFTGKPEPVQLASQLANRLGQSGLFYESHQAQWVAGERTLPALQMESKAFVTPESLLTMSPSNLASQSEQQASSSIGKIEVNAHLLSEEQATTSNKAEFTDSKFALNGHAAAKMPSIDEAHLQQIVRQQLDLIENKPLIWQGQAWPNQDLLWQIQHNEERSHSEAEVELVPQWQTSLQLSLPRLGELGVIAQLKPDGFHLRFQALNESTLNLLKAQQPALLARFEAAGLKLSSALVHRGDDER
ncbi:flagellar hook-length control protein FliK [Chitinibacter fontanus]|uniref:Flagellar hook-length control protein FliK n=1 Tax=Chitinibacter fontanus TaxID=1737446 RepID=A0A7D5Z219_9NEIS|nr:flagellar hook-length control protein FliK [Chitinibacter fontanus]QLI80123.1 flagellar hook-length control protein FliK [Chitinibacter fontanus]